MNALEICLIILLLTTMFFTGYMARELQGQYIADEYLTEKVQEQQWTIQDLKMELQRCEYNAGVIDEIVLPVYVRG